MAKKELEKIDVENPAGIVTEIDGISTFDGALVKYWKLLASTSYTWNLDTQQKYLDDYRNYLAPHFRGQPMSAFTDLEYFERVIDEVRRQKAAEQRARSKAIVEKAEPQTDPMQHFRYILRFLFRIVSEAEGFANPFKGTSFALINPETQEDFETRLRTTIKKSFTPLQEYRLFSILLQDPLAEGEYLGLLGMAVWGLRNGESCGLTYRDIRVLNEKTKLYVVTIHKTTKPGSRRLRSYGKTSNFYRILIVPPKIYDFLMQRKEHLQKLIDAGVIKLGGKIKSVDDLPIACKGREWEIRCKNDEITEVARNVFTEIELTDDQLAYFRSKPDETDLLGNIAWEPDYTAYACRRNMASWLFMLDVPRVYIERWMGHALSDPNYRLSDFSHQDFLETYQHLLMRRPIVYDVAWHGTHVNVCDHTQLSNVTRFSASIPGNGQRVRITITPYLPHETMEVWMQRIGNVNSPLHVRYGQSPSQAKIPDEILVRQEIHDEYRQVYRRIRDSLPLRLINPNDNFYVFAAIEDGIDMTSICNLMGDHCFDSLKTTLEDDDDLRRISKISSHGAYVHMYYLESDNAEGLRDCNDNMALSISDIERQNSRWSALEAALPLCNRITFVDTSIGMTHVATYQRGELVITEAGKQRQWINDFCTWHKSFSSTATND